MNILNGILELIATTDTADLGFQLRIIQRINRRSDGLPQEFVGSVCELECSAVPYLAHGD